MKRYIVDRSVLSLLDVETKSAISELGQSKVITNEALHFNSLPYVSLMLTDEQVKLLKVNDVSVTEEQKGGCVLGATYEKERSKFVKVQRKAITGKGVKIAVLDSGTTNSVVTADFELNVIDAEPGVVDGFGHGTRVVSIIKHAVIGIAPDCEFHMIKTIDSAGHTTESAVLAALDYVLNNNIDFVNLSWTFLTSSIKNSIAAVIANGTVVCAASGNDSTDAYTVYPAALKDVVAVNSIDEAGNPGYKNKLVPNNYTGDHGISVACSGIACEGYNRAGVYSSGWGTSFSCPFFVGLLACYKEELNESDNKKVLEYALNRALKTTQPLYFGAGIASF